jgi:hypothetical protein
LTEQINQAGGEEEMAGKTPTKKEKKKPKKGKK